MVRDGALRLLTMRSEVLPCDEQSIRERKSAQTPSARSPLHAGAAAADRIDPGRTHGVLPAAASMDDRHAAAGRVGHHHRAVSDPRLRDDVADQRPLGCARILVIRSW